jgi:hypothetical protein
MHPPAKPLTSLCQQIDPRVNSPCRPQTPSCRRLPAPSRGKLRLPPRISQRSCHKNLLPCATYATCQPSSTRPLSSVFKCPANSPIQSHGFPAAAAAGIFKLTFAPSIPNFSTVCARDAPMESRKTNTRMHVYFMVVCIFTAPTPPWRGASVGWHEIIAKIPSGFPASFQLFADHAVAFNDGFPGFFPSGAADLAGDHVQNTSIIPSFFDRGSAPSPAPSPIHSFGRGYPHMACCAAFRSGCSKASEN